MLSNSDQNLPEDVVNEILSRLPVKSLLRFKRVCRYWYTLIKSPAFIGKHFNQENNKARLLVHHYISNIDRYIISLFPDETLVGIPPLREDLDHLQILGPIANIVGPIDGIFFLHDSGFSDGNRMALWNPAMREFKRLHVPQPIFPSNFRVITDTFGFGLDPLTSDCKVIWIRYFVEDGDDVTEESNPYPYYVVALYTSHKDSWRHFDLLTISTEHDFRNSLCATCINGAYYWVSKVNSKCRIISFDMSLEVFREIEGPDHPEHKLGTLSLYNDSIALFLCQTSVVLQALIDIWVMEEDGCWTKLLAVKPSPEVLRPLGFWKNEEILLESHTKELVLYNHDTHEIRNLEVYGYETHFCLWAFCYKESLLSVMGQNEDKRGCYDFSVAVHDFFVPGRSRSIVPRE